MPFELHTEVVQASGATPRRLSLVLHGVFGSGANWRSFMRAVAAARPDWGFVLCDLRGHGRSLGARPPHDLEAMADDLERLDGRFDAPIAGVIGHSLGGKVALCYAARRPGRLSEVWVLDSQPGARVFGGPTIEVLELLESLPAAFADRDAFVDAVKAGGQSQVMAAWLAMNVRRAGDEYLMELDLPALRLILESYYQTDMWPEIARRDPARALRVVVGGKSAVWQPGDADRLRALAAENPQLHVRELPAAGHWLHVDAPDELRQLFVSELGRA
jgi:pimeloyl-ACP methyl ester carboxylesterase